MIMPNARALTVPALRTVLDLSSERPDGVRDIIAVLRPDENIVPDDATTADLLALGDWPEIWRADPASGPKYLITLRGLNSPHRIAGVWEIDPAGWGREPIVDPARRRVPLIAPAYVPSAVLVGQTVDIGMTFGWTNPEDQFAFL